MIVLRTLREQSVNAVAVTAATREPIRWTPIIAASLLSMLVAFVLGMALANAVGATSNVQGDSKGFSICQGPVTGGVYVNVSDGTVGAFQGCDF